MKTTLLGRLLLRRLRQNESRRRAAASARACRDVQVREFEGALYLAYRDTPLVALKALAQPADAAAAVRQSRETLSAYYYQEQEAKRPKWT